MTISLGPASRKAARPSNGIIEATCSDRSGVSLLISSLFVPQSIALACLLIRGKRVNPYRILSSLILTFTRKCIIFPDSI